MKTKNGVEKTKQRHWQVKPKVPKNTYTQEHEGGSGSRAICSS